MKTKRKISQYILLFLSLSMLLIAFAPNRLNVVKAEDDTTLLNANEPDYMGIFIVEKSWSNDKDKNDEYIKDENGNRIRPTSVNITIEGSNGSEIHSQLLESKQWKETFRLPTKSGTDDITYKVYETDNLAKYKSNATGDSEDSKLDITLVNTGRNSSAFNVSPTGFSNIPQPTVSINPNLDLELATITYPDDVSYGFGTNKDTYTNATKESEVFRVNSVLYYKGHLDGPGAGEKHHDTTIPGSIVLEWADSTDPNGFHPATDIYGNTHPITITLSNITVRTLAPLDKQVAILAYTTRLMMQSYVCEFTNGVVEKNLVGVKADIEVKINGVPANNYTMAIFDDIDIPNWVDYYADEHVWSGNNYFGTAQEFAESVQLLSNISSDVYVNGPSPTKETYLVWDEDTRKFASKANNNDSTYEGGQTMMIFLAPASGYKFQWAGSCCGTSIFNDVYLPNIINTITNKSGLYKARYFFQNDDGSYPEEPNKEDGLMMIKPDSKISVNNNAKKDPKVVDPTKTNYTLDTTRTKVDEEKIVTIENDVDNPQVLNVYFKKNCVVVYHDNINEDLSIGTLWDPANETTSENLYFESVTPAFKEFDGDVTKANPGYKFTGWSIVNPENREETPLANDDILPKVDRVETHYLAHWEALPNQYIVEYYYEKNGLYPPTPDDRSPIRTEYNGERVYTDSFVKVEDSDLIPDPKMGKYVLNDAMKGDWQGTVKANGLVLKVYFKQKSERLPYEPPVTGIH